jgi:hypothetical protein
MLRQALETGRKSDLTAWSTVRTVASGATIVASLGEVAAA